MALAGGAAAVIAGAFAGHKLEDHMRGKYDKTGIAVKGAPTQQLQGHPGIHASTLPQDIAAEASIVGTPMFLALHQWAAVVGNW